MKKSKIIDDLISLRDEKYKSFIAGLVPNISKDVIIGVRTPELRKYAKKLSFGGEAASFLDSLPHQYFEENNLHAFIIQKINDFDTCISRVEKFLPYIDNWATCDGLRPVCFKHNKQKLFPIVEKWLSSNHTYTVRFGIGMLNSYFLDDAFEEKHLLMAVGIRSDEYYVKMMIAWYFASALSFHYEKTVKYFEEPMLDKWIHNKAIQKAIESKRIPDERKMALRCFKI